MVNNAPFSLPEKTVVQLFIFAKYVELKNIKE